MTEDERKKTSKRTGKESRIKKTGQKAGGYGSKTAGAAQESPDIVMKDFEAYPDVAADIINALIYDGKYRFQEKQLFPAPTESIYETSGRIRNQLEDLATYEMVGDNVNAMYLFANQKKKDSGMILRKAGYVGGAYRAQYEGKIRDRCPVMEIVMYWGMGRWKKNLNMREMFENKELSAKAWDYIDDIKLHVFEMRYLPEEVRKLFTSDMRIVVDYLAEGDSYVSGQKVVHKAALIKMIRVLSGDKNVDDTEKILAEMNIGEEDDVKVCELFEQYERRGRQQGMQQGLQQGMQQGIQQGMQQGMQQGIVALISTCKDFNSSFADTEKRIKEKFNLSDAEVKKSMQLYW